MRGCLSGCLVDLVFRVIGFVFVAVFRALGFVLMLMVTATTSVFVGFDRAIERIADSWIEQSTGQGVLIGYNPGSREMLRVGAAFMLGLGWILNFGVILLGGYITVSIMASIISSLLVH